MTSPNDLPADLGTRFSISQNTKRVSFNMSAKSEAVHVDGDKDRNMDETSEEAELQSTVLTLESILLHLVILFSCLVFDLPNLSGRSCSFRSAVNL